MNHNATYFSYSVRILLERAGKILLLERIESRGGFSLPGGKVEKNESPLQAIKRETFEEIGLKLKKKQLHFLHTLQRKRKQQVDELVYFFSCNKWEGKLAVKEPHKFKAIRWFDKNALPQDLSEVYVEGIKAIEAGRVMTYFRKKEKTG